MKGRVYISAQDIKSDGDLTNRVIICADFVETLDSKKPNSRKKGEKLCCRNV